MLTCDQLNRPLKLENVPQRIISLVPSLTEFFIDLGLNVVGRTRFCIHPLNKISEIPRVGGTKDFKLEKILELKPDIVIASKEENEKTGILALEKKVPVYVSDILDLKSAYSFMDDMGSLFQKEKETSELVQKIKGCFLKFLPSKCESSVLYFIWKDPYIAVGPGTFINSLLEECHFKNLISLKSSERYPQLDLNQLKFAPDFVFLSSEPYPFREKHIAEISELLPSAKIMLVDGELFSWYGSRLIKSVAYFEDLLKKMNQ